MPSRQLAAVLFDLDGTLVDSEKIWGIALFELAARYGGVLTDAVRTRMIGASSADTMAMMLDHVGQPWRDPAEGSAWLDVRVRELFAEGLVWRPGAPELLKAVRAAGWPTALVTNTNRPLVELALSQVGPFDVVVCGDEVDRPKPDPQPYALAAARSVSIRATVSPSRIRRPASAVLAAPAVRSSRCPMRSPSTWVTLSWPTSSTWICPH